MGLMFDEYDGWFQNFYNEGDALNIFDAWWFMATDQYPYTFKQGESINVDVKVVNKNRQPVEIDNPDSMIVVLFVKNQPWAGYSYGLPSGTTFNNNELTYQTGMTWTGNDINIFIDSLTSSTFPAGQMRAYIKTKKGNQINEYGYLLALIEKCHLNNYLI